MSGATLPPPVQMADPQSGTDVPIGIPHHYYPHPSRRTHTGTDVDATSTTEASCASCTRGIFVKILQMALITLESVVYIVVGHAILRITSHKGYDSTLYSSVKVGALGVSVWIIPSLLFDWVSRALKLKPLPPWRRGDGLSFKWCLCAMGAGLVKRHHVHNALDPLHAARAGALGGVVVGSVEAVLVSVIKVNERMLGPWSREKAGGWIRSNGLSGAEVPSSWSEAPSDVQAIGHVTRRRDSKFETKGYATTVPWRGGSVKFLKAADLSAIE
ncbi:hypothetical protein JAAARDRAFT_80268 [Jaapia argillacea MUCL 33604]|uniref:Uncharacterized protein n=1 Tax=Jaapia argillacea MUCL 33604 TaxID=933084 RepID=A0A067PLH6_9AGAM|nr:hypothetical protein JAAARDRAFT_80268 [Jaapia argillacea MUCL 33604]